jgi:CMP-N,N'-diacetyllegionaminic acid synthase
MRPLVVIPARGGSKGIPGKNIKPLAGKPLIYYTIEAAREVFPDELIIISTDNDVIKACVELTGLKVPFLRPPELATDTAGTYEVLLHAVKFVELRGYFPDALMLLQPTSPFRNSSHIREAMKLYDETIEMVVSVKETKSNPYYILFEENEDGWLVKSKKGDFSTRQFCPKVWEYNGGIYIINIGSLKEKPINEFTKIRKFVMDEWSSHDIDTILDWEVAEVMAKINNLK